MCYEPPAISVHLGKSLARELWGRSESGEDELPFDDLVIALRSIRGAYGPGVPGVDLSWKSNEEFFTKSKEILARRDYHAYEQLCAEMGLFSRVIALPQNSQLTKVLLDADWTMKAVGIGTKILKVRNPLRGRTPAYVDLLRKVYSGKASPTEKEEARLVSTNPNSQLWFRPGRMSYVRDGDSKFIDCVQVLLSALNRDANGGHIEPNPILQRFTCSWSNRMDEILDTEPEWKAMRGIFRTFALARIIQGNQDTLRLEDRGLINDYPVSLMNVPTKYPHIVKFSTIPEKPTWRGSTCGGVRVNYHNTARTEDPAPSTSSDVTLAGRRALDSMRSCTGESCWRVE
jgi:hypothetical protein